MIFFKKKKIKQEEKKEEVKEEKLREDKKDNEEKLNFQSINLSNFKNINFGVLKSILITEKTNNFISLNKYCFLVSLKANKNMIKEAIEKKYNVKVADVNIIRLKAKKKFWRNKESYFQDKKKAIVTLKEGYKIEF